MLNGTRTPRTRIEQLCWHDLSLATRARFVLTLIVLPLIVGLYAHFEWSATLGDPQAGFAGVVVGVLVGVAIRPRKQAAR